MTTINKSIKTYSCQIAVCHKAYLLQNEDPLKKVLRINN